MPVIDGQLSCSAGVAVYPDDAEDRETLLEHADNALYTAKRGGKGQTKRFDSSSKPVTRIPSSEAAQLGQVLADEEAIVSVFQPVVACDGRVIG